MTSQQQQPNGERASRAKSSPKREPATPNSSQQQQQASCAPPFDFLVPMNICVRCPPSQQQQPQVDEQPVVERLSWALLDRRTGQVESNHSVRVGSPREAAEQVGCSLGEAIQQVEKSFAGRKCALVTCGPVPLRQHLQPIAKRLRVELADHFSQYVDLLKEFDRCTFANNLTGRQVARANLAACACCCAAACESPPTGCANKAASLDQENAQSEPVTSSGPQLAAEEPLSVPQQQPQQVSQQQQQPISQGSRKRFEEILKFLAISLDTGKKKPACPASLAGRQCNCSACSQAFVEASCAIVERLLREGHPFNRLERIQRRVEVGLCETSAHEAEQRVVRARGLPWQASEQDIADFFTGLNIAKGGVGLCLSRQGRRNGEALIQFESREHRNLALSRHKHFMGNRYIEVYRASGDDFQSVAAGYNNKAEAFISKGAQFIVRMRGLPFTCTAMQVVEFFASSDAKTKACEVFGGEEGVLFVRNQDEKPTGDAFVLFASDEHTRRAIAKHHQNIGTRYVELFRSTVSEVQQVLSVSNGGGGGGDEQASPSGASKQQSASPAKAKQQAFNAADKSKSSATKSPVSKSNATKLTSQLASRSAFPALSEVPVAWQRPEAATYAQVALSSRSDKSPTKPQQQEVEQKSSTSADSDKSAKVANDLPPAEPSHQTGAEERCAPDAKQSDCNDVVLDGVGQVKSAESSGPPAETCIGGGVSTEACAKLAEGRNEETSSRQPSAPQSPASCAAPSPAPPATPSMVRSPISSLCSSSEGSSTSNLSHKQTAAYPQHHNQQAGWRRHQNQHYHQNGRSSTRYQQQQHGYVYQPMLQQQQQQAVLYNQELMQTTMAQHPASMAQSPYSAPHYQMAYATGQAQSLAAAFDLSQQLAHQHPPPPPYSANSMEQQQQQRAQQVFATATSDPAFMSRRDCIRLRGLPFEAQIDDVLHFLGKHSENILYQGVHMVYSAQGQPTGEAIIQMNSIQAASAAAQEAHRRVMSLGKKQRYIEVIPSSIDDLKPTLGYGLAAFAAARAAATYGFHPMHYAAYAAAGPMGPMDPMTGYHQSAVHHPQQLPYMEPAADCYSLVSGDPRAAETLASASTASSETGLSPTPEQTSKQASDPEPSSEEAVGAAPVAAKPAGKPEDTIQEAKETQSEARAASSELRAHMSPANSTQPITTTATSSSQSMQHEPHLVQQQQALMAAAQASAYYPILYYYPPPPPQQQPILASAAPAANRYY